jgi:CRP-like cAMP-binding protein
MSSKAFLAECESHNSLPATLRRYTHSLISQISQAAACFRFHPVEKRLARLLLMTADRMQSLEFPITQEFLSHMLGVRREAVNRSAGGLQTRGLIKHCRGYISIIGRKNLMKASCSCYAIIRSEERAVQSL